jgi:hypothetical protein
MKIITYNSFNNELEKLSASGIVGDILAAGLLGGLTATGAHHVKGMKEAIKAGAGIKQALKAYPLPLGKEWKFKPLQKGKTSLVIDMGKMYNPHKETNPYDFHMRSQERLGNIIAMPIGATPALIIAHKKIKKD